MFAIFNNVRHELQHSTRRTDDLYDLFLQFMMKIFQGR